MKLTRTAWQHASTALGYGLLAMAFAWIALAQGVSTTTVQGTVYLANGQPGAGKLQVSWPAFTTPNGQAVTAGHLTATIGADGFVSVNLTPNLGATPAGLFYTAVYHMADGTTSTEYWVVPSAAQATIGSVRSQVMPAAQAVQAASKAYVDQAILSLTTGSLSPVGGTLTGPLYLSGDPTQALQAADKHYVDITFAQAMPLSGGAATGPLTATQLGGAWQVDQFAGADFGAKLQACISGLSSAYGGTCDARNFTGTQAMASNVTIATANTTVLLPCATIATTKQILVTAGTRNVSLRGCSLRGASGASGSAGGTVFLYSGAAGMIQVGDPTYAADTQGFHLDNAVINTTGATTATAQALAAYRTQEMELQSLYLLGNANQTGMTLDGTGNYTGGTFYDIAANGFQIAISGIGHQVANAASTDWLNASTFVRVHLNCPTSGGSPIAGTVGINLAQGDGNTFTGGDVEGCGTALHLGPNAQNNTLIGLRNENSTNQIVADAGSAYNNWITGGTMFTGKLVDNGTRNSFLDTFHRAFNGIYGDWYGSQQDATVTNHYRLGTGQGNERGLLDRYQTDYGYRWTMGLTDATAGAQFFQVQDELNNVSRLSIGQYLTATANTVTNVALNSGGCYASNTAPTLSFSGGGGSGAAGTANMVVSRCSGGYTVGSVTMTNNGSGYTSQPAIAWSGGSQISVPSAVAEIATVGSTNNQTVINAAGTGAVVLNGANNSGTGGVVIGSGGPSVHTAATISGTGNANFVGTLQVGGTSTFVGSTTVRNGADAEIDAILQAGSTTEQKESFVYRDHTGVSQWYLVKDQNNNWALNSAVSGVNSFKAYQSTNSGDTYVNASSPAGVVRVNYEPNTGSGMKIYGGNSSTLYAAFTGTTAIQFPGLAAASGRNCLQIDNSGYVSNTGAACGSSGGGGGSGTVNSGTSGQIAYYSTNGAAVSGISTVPVSAGGTGASTASGALTALGAASLTATTVQSFSGSIVAPTVNASVNGLINVMAPPYNAKGDCTTDDHDAITAALHAADDAATRGGLVEVEFPAPPGGCYLTSTLEWHGESLKGLSSNGAGSTPQDASPVYIHGEPGQDILHAPDPDLIAHDSVNAWAIQDLGFILDTSVVGSFPHRWPGRWFDDSSMTAGSAVIKTTNGNVSCADIGQAMKVSGAGAAGADLVTTIASVTPCWASYSAWQVITLNDAASTSVTNAHTYVSVLGLPVTETLPQAVIAMDDYDADKSHWVSPGERTGSLYNRIHNVGMNASGGTSPSGMGIYIQGQYAQYGLDVQNINLRGFAYHIVEGTAELNSFKSSNNGDFQTWRHISTETGLSPWISYNGEYIHIEDWEITTVNGPVMLGVGNQYSDGNQNFQVSNVEFEGNTGYGWITTSPYANFDGVTLSNALSSHTYWGGDNNVCRACATGPITLGSNLATLSLVSNTTSSTVTDLGRGNTVQGTRDSNPPFTVPVSYPIARSPYKSANAIQGRFGWDFLDDGNSVPYNKDDLFLWPQDFIWNLSGGANPYTKFMAQDSTSLTGYHINMIAGAGFSNFSQLMYTATNGQIVVGTNIPASQATMYLSVSCPAGTTSFSVKAVITGGSYGYTSTPTQTFACSSSYATYSYVQDFSAYSGGSISIVNAGTTTWYIGWVYLQPFKTFNGYTPAHAGANADITSTTSLWNVTAPTGTDIIVKGATGQSVRLQDSTGWNNLVVVAGQPTQLYSGADIEGQALKSSGNTIIPAGTTGSTGTGSVVLSNAPALVSPTISGNTVTLANGAAAEQDLVIKPGTTAEQIGAYALANYAGTTQWKLRKDASNYLRLTDSVNSLDREILYQNGQTIINAGAGSNPVVLNGTANSGSGGLLVQSGGASPATVLTVSGSGNTTVTGFIAGKSYAGSGTMTLAAGTAAGTSPTIACAASHVCDGVSGDVTLTTGTSPTTGTLATLTFPSTHTNYANCMIRLNSSTVQITSVTWNETASAVTLTANAALTASTAYQVRYWCGGN